MVWAWAWVWGWDMDKVDLHFAITLRTCGDTMRQWATTPPVLRAHTRSCQRIDLHTDTCIPPTITPSKAPSHHRAQHCSETMTATTKTSRATICSHRGEVQGDTRGEVTCTRIGTPRGEGGIDQAYTRTRRTNSTTTTISRMTLTTKMD